MRLSTALISLVFGLALAGCTKSAPVANEPQTEAVPSAELVAHFDAQAGELPEGLALTNGAAFVGFAPTSRVVKVDLTTGQSADYGQLPAPVPNQGFMTGLVQAANGDVYAGLASFVPDVQPGIYRIPQEGGAAELFAKDAALPFPNGLAFDDDGSLFVTDSGTGSIFRIGTDGHAERWASGDALLGNKDACNAAGPGFAIGANGIVVEHDAVYVTNLDQATLVKVPRERDGSAGKVATIAGPDCDTLGGADGLARAADGSFVVAVNRQNKLVKVTAQGETHDILNGAPLDFPASVQAADNALFVTNFALQNASTGKPATPALVRLRAE